MCGEGVAFGVWRLAFGGFVIVLVVVLVLVLEKGRLVCESINLDGGISKPRSGGEPLLMWLALSVGSRRLPGITQRDILPNAAV
jgi:hypothetical protein